MSYTQTMARNPVPTPRKPSEKWSGQALLSELGELPRDGESASRIRAEVVELYRPAALREADRYRNRGVDAEELHQVASLGLMKAIAGFDPSHNKPFLSYLLPTVSGEIKRHFRDHHWAVHAPRSCRDRRSELNRFIAEYIQHNAREPRQDEIGSHFGLNAQATGELLNGASAYSALSLDTPNGADREEDGEPLGHAIGGTDRELESVADRVTLRSAIVGLTRRQQRVVALRFWDELSQLEIARLLGCSQMQVSRILTAILSRLRSNILAEG
ncbi:sigma-70 family RNA polymerase sigma factor [Nocardiopsis oceani]